jgi:CheY-like chemotaxis protein
MARMAPDLVVLDIRLPGMDGTEVLARMRADPRLSRVPAIALTAHAMTGDGERYLAAGFDEYVSKPITDEQDFLSVVQRLTGRADARA